MVYFSNHSESGVLEAQCAECRLSSDDACPVFGVQIHYNYDQIGNDKLKGAMEMAD